MLDFDHFFFDLDGTLSDSKADVLGSIEQAYRNLGFAYDKSRLKIGPLLPARNWMRTSGLWRLRLSGPCTRRENTGTRGFSKASRNS